MRIKVTLVGQTPLMMHNAQLVDPDNKWSKLIKGITDKGSKMTDEDRQTKGRYEWFGGLYIGHGGVVMPTANIRRCFQEAGKATKHGKAITRAVIPVSVEVPLVHNGPRHLDKLFEQVEFIDRRAVGVGKNRVMRTRPIFPAWQLECEFELVINLIDSSSFGLICSDAGRLEGLGDDRINGFGRFSVTIEEQIA